MENNNTSDAPAVYPAPYIAAEDAAQGCAAGDGYRYLGHGEMITASDEWWCINRWLVASEGKIRSLVFTGSSYTFRRKLPALGEPDAGVVAPQPEPQPPAVEPKTDTVVQPPAQDYKGYFADWLSSGGGTTVRQQVAMCAMQGLLSCFGYTDGIAIESVRAADALIAELAKNQEPNHKP